MNLINWLFGGLEDVPKSTAGLEFQYIVNSSMPDEVVIFRDGKKLIQYDYIDGVDAEKYSRLWKWHCLYESRCRELKERKA